MKTYSVLWIDDECKKPSGIQFITDAEQEGIIITEYEVAEDGMKVLEDNPHTWDAVILDAKGFHKSTHETPDLEGLYSATTKIAELKRKKAIPWFVLTGQPDRMNNREFEITLGGKKPYNKSLTEDKERLFKDIKAAADKNLDTYIRHKYADVFATTVDKTMMLKLLKAVHENDNKNAAHLNDIRKIMEDFFQECVTEGVIPSYTTQFNGRSKHLCDWGNNVCPDYIKRQIHLVTTVTQTGSHRTQTDKDIQDGNAPYLTEATVKSLLSIIIWWDKYKKANC